ncbi:hypothetical protein [Rugamonas aquatica]|uniref:Type II secretion system protein n=1 Tax=Rugamonas aquatica TaxID=2743357 RepID=A0A6A7NCF4_9BURK|nr:hypothetical protein [Rugamonas aquatica]MQA42803.1 hypothetical protein [Rugamonas aquatica]
MATSRNWAASRRRQRGAALLLLLAMTSVGAAAVLISALSHDSAQQQRRLQLLTLERMALAREALVGYAATNGRLPRPAVSATDGNESPTPCATEQDCTGFLPWVTLGVDGADAWGKLLRYSVTPVYTRAPVLRISAIATKTVRGRSANGEYYYLAGQSACDPGAQCAPLVLLSHGRGNFGTSALGVAQANTGQGNLDERQNAEADLHFISRAASADPATPGGEFDDLVLAVPLSYLYKQMAAAHRLP